MGMMVACLVGICTRLLFVQGLDASSYMTAARSEYVHEVALAAERGAILDRNGNEFAMSVPMTTVFADPYQVTNPRLEAQALSRVLGLPQETLQNELSEPSGFVYLARTISNSEASGLSSLMAKGPSRASTRCRNPSGSTRRDSWRRR